MKVTEHANGKFCWAELQTTDGPAAKTFYTTLFDVQAVDIPMGEGMVYTMYNVNGENVGAQYEDKSSEAPPHWNTYISVDDVDAAASKARELGATLIAEPFDVMDVGRMAVVQDPTGAIFCLWKAKRHIGYTLINEPGSVCWNELHTRDTKAAEAFYTGLLGYGIKHSDMGMPYTEFQLEGKSIAGMMEIGPDMRDVPPHWMIYWTVKSCDETFAKAQSLGAKPVVEPMHIPGVGKMAVMQDPQGAHFAFVD